MRSYSIGRGLERQGIRVVIISASYFHKYLHPPNVHQDVTVQEIDGITYCWIRVPKYEKRRLGQVFNQLAFTFRLSVRIRQLPVRDPSFVIASSPHPFVSLPAWWAAKYFGVPFVFEIRDLWPLAIQELGKFPAWHPYIMLLAKAERFSCLRADHIVSVKPGDINYLGKKYGIPDERFSYIPNGVSDAEKGGSEAFPKEWEDIFSGRFVVGYAGGLSKYYALEHLVAAAKIVQGFSDEIRFVLAGKGESRDLLEMLIGNHGIRNVTFLGPIDKGLVHGFLSRCHVCFLGLAAIEANRYGISCNKLYDYMQAAKPVLCSSNVPDYLNPVVQASCGLGVEAESAEAIAEGITRLFNISQVERDVMGSRGLAWVRKNHDMKQIADRYLGCLESLRV